MTNCFGIAFYSFDNEFQVLFQVISYCGQIHQFVRLFYSNGVNFLKARKRSEDSKYRLYCTLPLASHVPNLFVVYSCIIALIFILITGYDNVLFLTLF